MYEVVSYRRRTNKQTGTTKVARLKVVARFDDLNDAHEYARDKSAHCVRYSRKAIKELNA